MRLVHVFILSCLIVDKTNASSLQKKGSTASIASSDSGSSDGSDSDSDGDGDPMVITNKMKRENMLNPRQQMGGLMGIAATAANQMFAQKKGDESAAKKEMQRIYTLAQDVAGGAGATIPYPAAIKVQMKKLWDDMQIPYTAIKTAWDAYLADGKSDLKTIKPYGFDESAGVWDCYFEGGPPFPADRAEEQVANGYALNIDYVSSPTVLAVIFVNLLAAATNVIFCLRGHKERGYQPLMGQYHL